MKNGFIKMVNNLIASRLLSMRYFYQGSSFNVCLRIGYFRRVYSVCRYGLYSFRVARGRRYFIKEGDSIFYLSKVSGVVRSFVSNFGVVQTVGFLVLGCECVEERVRLGGVWGRGFFRRDSYIFLEFQILNLENIIRDEGDFLLIFGCLGRRIF